MVGAVVVVGLGVVVGAAVVGTFVVLVVGSVARTQDQSLVGVGSS